MCAYQQYIFSFFWPTHSSCEHGYCVCVCGCVNVCVLYVCVVVPWVSAMSRRYTSSHTFPIQTPYCFFFPIQ